MMLGAGIWGSDPEKDCEFEDTLITMWISEISIEKQLSCYIACKE